MPKTLLLADDSVTIQKVVGISFASEDIALVAVDNGTAAVAKAKEVRPDILLADVVMPGLSGYEVCRAIKGDPALRHIPVLLLTGTFEAFDEAKAREVGADGHITKPFEAQSLVDTVNQRLAAAAAARAASAPAAAAAPAKAAPAPAAGSLFKDDEPFDFLQEETTEPSGLSTPTKPEALVARGERADDESFSFADTADDLESADALEAEPLEMDDALTQMDAPAAAAAPFVSDEDASAETLPPGAAVLLDEAEAPAATQVLFAEGEAAGDPQDTRVLFSTPEPTGVGTVSARDVGVSDPLAELIGGDRIPAESRYDVSATDLGDPFAGDDAEPEPILRTSATTLVMETSRRGAWADEEPASAPAPMAPPAAAVAAAAGAAGAVSAISREEMRAMIEKIAWEALGDVTDRIVRDSVQRIEQIAWEVIPRMAETLIQEEIRKLKGES